MTYQLLTSAALAYLLVDFTVPGLRYLAHRVRLVDVADSQRKIHTDRVPLIGGIAMALSILTTLAINVLAPVPPTGWSVALLAGAMVLLAVGVIDDKVNLSPFLKLAVQALCAGLLVAQNGYLDGSLAMVGLGQLPLWGKQLLTGVVIVGVMNAYNLIDGIDGLAGALFIAGFCWLTGISLFLGQAEWALLSAATAAALSAFLKSNTASHNKIFMGDGGSLFLGFLLSGLGVLVVERGYTTDYAATIIVGTATLLAIPVLDALRVFATRMQAGRSPFYPDRTHIHHIFLQVASSHRSVRNWIVSLALLQFAVSVVLCLGPGLYWAVAWISTSVLLALYLIGLQQRMYADREALRKLERQSVQLEADKTDNQFPRQEKAKRG